MAFNFYVIVEYGFISGVSNLDMGICLNIWGWAMLFGVCFMSILTVDDRRRVKLPKGVVSPGDKVVMLIVGSRIVLIPIPPRPLEASSSWLRSGLSRRELRRLAEEGAVEDVARRLKRRNVNRG